MKELYLYIFLKILDLFTSEQKFDIESFTSRLKIKIEDNSQEIVNLRSIPPEFTRIYPALQPLLEYILDTGSEGDENRKTFVKYVTGSEYSPDQIIILFSNETMNRDLHKGLALYGHACASKLDLYRAHANFNGEITKNMINIQLKTTTSNINAEE